MPKYYYTAKSLTTGENKSGFLEAADVRQLSRAIRQEGLILINAEAESEKKPKKEKTSFALPFQKVSFSDKMFFARNLQVMISAGLPLPRALQTLASQTKSKVFKDALSDVALNITKGKNFSECISKYPDIFSEFFQSMLKIGEESGTMEDVLKTLALQMEKEEDLRSKIMGAMMYPAVIIVAMIGVGILMLVTIVPKLAETFAELNVNLPMTTKLVIAFANFLTSRWYAAAAILLLLVIGIKRLSKTKKGKRMLDIVTLKIPIISPIIRKTNSAYTMRTLSSLITAGVPLTRSLEITYGTLGNIFYKEAIMKVSEKVRQGEKLSEAMAPYGNIYPLTMLQMIAVGEETGETSTVLARLADFYENEVAAATKNLASVIEPVLMLIIGVVVGFFAVSMLQPMYSMLNAIK